MICLRAMIMIIFCIGCADEKAITFSHSRKKWYPNGQQLY